MTSFDDQLRELIRSGGPEPEALQGDVGDVRARVRRRVRRRRAAVAAVAVAAAAVVGTAGLALTDPGRGSNVITNQPQTTELEPGPTTPTPSSPSTTEASTTPPNEPPARTSTPRTTAVSTAPPAPSIRDVSFGDIAYDGACAGFGDDRSATLSGGAARLPMGEGVFYEVTLGPVSVADADGDGDEDAVLLLRCMFAGASTDNQAQLRAYRLGDDGQVVQIGPSQILEHVHGVVIEGVTATVQLDKYSPTDAACCPSTGAREVWRFEGDGFVMSSTTPIDPPGAGG